VRHDRPLLNDFVTDEEFNRLLDAWFGNIGRVLLPQAARCIAWPWPKWFICGWWP
jgi:hypothetical protein